MDLAISRATAPFAQLVPARNTEGAVIGSARGLCKQLPSALLLSFAFLTAAHAAPQDEIRATFDRFVVAQNDHDIAKVEPLLLASPDFLWITRGTAIWGSEAALKRFAALYEGTWRLEPDAAMLKIIMVNQDVAQLFVPISFTIGTAGQPAQTTRFLMNQVLIKTNAGWRVSSILPIPAPAQ
jgi:ketosteroid isomerase-like protein